MKNILKSIIALIILYLIYFNRNIVVNSTLLSIEMFNKKIFPSIFPIMIISDIILSTDIILWISNTLGIIFNKLFKLSKYSAYVFIASSISGCPSNAKYIKDLLDNKCISKKEAEKLLSMTLLYNPLLIMSLTSFLNKKDSIIIIISNIIINLFIGFINRNYQIDYINNNLKRKKFNLTDSISNAINSLITIFGIITCFNILNNLLPIKHPLINGIFELTTGLNGINSLDVNYNNKIIYTIILLSFGGLSIIMQIKSIFKKDTLDYSLFYKSRIIHLIIFIILISIKL